MSAKIIFSKLRNPGLLATGFLLLACETNIPPEYGMIDWYLANGTDSSMTLRVYDLVCKRNYSRVRLGRSAETPISTCANSDGNAEVRYQRAGVYNGRDNPWRNGVISSNRTLLVR